MYGLPRRRITNYTGTEKNSHAGGATTPKPIMNGHLGGDFIVQAAQC